MALLAKLQLLVLVITSGLAAADFRSDLAGIRTLFPDSDGYASVSQPYNRRFTFEPAAIAFPSTPKDVSAIVRAGAANGMKVVPRGGGHSYIANGLGGENGTVVVDMSNMKAIKINSAARTVEIQMGTRLGDIALALNNAGLALPHGTCPYVGVGGHTAFGGYGFTSRQWGLALDPITTVNAVLANGTRVVTTSVTNSDLFWAIRGAAPSFAITTSIVLNAFPAPSHAIGFQYTWELDAAAAGKAFKAYQDYCLAGTPSVMGSEINLSRGSSRGTISISLVGGWYARESSHGGLEASLAPFLSRMPKPSSSKKLGNGTYIDTVVQFGGKGNIDTSAPDSTDTFYAKSLMTTMGSPVKAKAFNAFAKYLAEEGFDSETSWFMQIEQYGGPGSAINNVSSGSTAFFRRDVLFTWQLYASSSNNQPPYPADGFTFVDNAVKSVTGNMPANWDYGAYTNYIDDRLEDWQQRYYGSNYKRLQKIKRIVDPNNVFQFPTSIEP